MNTNNYFLKAGGNISFRGVKNNDENVQKISNNAGTNSMFGNKSFVGEAPLGQREFGKDITNTVNENTSMSRKSIEVPGKNALLNV